MSANSWLKVTAYHMVETLTSGLYSSAGQCLMELIRNSLVASMPNDKWQPSLAYVELSLVQNHPLAGRGNSALVALDHGCGITDPAVDKYFHWLGPSLDKLRERKNGHMNGASQKGIGRLAALALNANCIQEEILPRTKHGYFLFSRTSTEGDIRFVTVIPEKVELEGFNTNRFIKPDATELHSLKGIKGPFTAIVIPTPIFKTTVEIYDAIKWLLPREKDKMFRLSIGGKYLEAPPLEEQVNITSLDGRYRARLGTGTEEGDGIWLCDSETGLRVASCMKIGRALPEPLWFPKPVGDIFAPGLLAYQDTARSSLNRDFWKKKVGQELYMFLIRNVAPAAEQLLDRDQ